MINRNSDDYRAGYFEELAKQVSRSLGRDNAHKQRIVARSPDVFSGMDAVEYEAASAAELATRELKELGITAKNSDPVELLDAHHAGREHARAQRRGVHGVSVKSSVMDAAGDSFMEKYLK